MRAVENLCASDEGRYGGSPLRERSLRLVERGAAQDQQPPTLDALSAADQELPLRREVVERRAPFDQIRVTAGGKRGEAHQVDHAVGHYEDARGSFQV